MEPSGYLLDENLPGPLAWPLTGSVRHARELGPGCTDTALWNLARDEGLVIVTKDADFLGRALLDSPPPWVVQLCCGNLRKRELLTLVEAVWPEVTALLRAHRLVRVFETRLEALS